jgi:hypothetical protein
VCSIGLRIIHDIAEELTFFLDTVVQQVGIEGVKGKDITEVNTKWLKNFPAHEVNIAAFEGELHGDVIKALN